MTDPPLNRLPEHALLIGGRTSGDGSGGVEDHVYAANGRVTRSVPLAGVREVDAAVSEARRAFETWRGMLPRDRARILHSIGDALVRHREELAQIQTIETSVPIAFSGAFAEIAARYFFYNAGWADKAAGEMVPAGSGALDYAIEEPYGVIGAIVPWNASLIAVCQILAPVLAAGNTVVLKPPPLAPFVAVRVAELALEAGLPPGVVNVVTGGAEAGEHLVRHPDVAKVHFTGSPVTARRVLMSAAERIAPVSLELGGKSPLVVFGDADPMAAAQQALTSMAGLCGQGCTLPTRVLVEEGLSDRFITLLKGLLRRVQIGDPFEDATQMGPLVSAAACARVLSAIDRARRENEGTLIMGGYRLDGSLGDGYYVAPTLFADVGPDSALAQEEIFGPVLSLFTFGDEDEAIRMANASRYGLAAYVFAADLRRAHRVAAALEAGSVWINGPVAVEPSMPFGGCKESGYGRLGGRAGIREFTRPKNVWLSVR